MSSIVHKLAVGSSYHLGKTCDKRRSGRSRLHSHSAFVAEDDDAAALTLTLPSQRRRPHNDTAPKMTPPQRDSPATPPPHRPYNDAAFTATLTTTTSSPPRLDGTILRRRRLFFGIRRDFNQICIEIASEESGSAGCDEKLMPRGDVRWAVFSEVICFTRLALWTRRLNQQTVRGRLNERIGSGMVM